MFRDQAGGIGQGLEPELSLVVDAMFPMTRLIDALRVFGERYPTVPTRIFVASMGATVNLVMDDTCAIGISVSIATQDPALHIQPIQTMAMLAVAAPCHPLSALAGPIPTHELQQHVQLVLTDQSGRTGHLDHGVLSSRNWRLGDLGAKHAMLLGGLGWGGMPRHMVEDDLVAGRLREIRPEDWPNTTGPVELQISLVYRMDRTPGPAARWLCEWFMSGVQRPPSEKPRDDADLA